MLISRKKRVKFIEFGFARYDHCLRDLTYFLFTSTQTPKVCDLIQCYIDHLKINLQKLNLSLPTNEFPEELRKIACEVHPLATRVIRVVRRGQNKDKQLAYSRYVLRELKCRPEA